MTNPIVSNVTAVQGTGGTIVESVIEVTYDLANANGNASHLTAQLSNDGGSNWHTCLLHSSNNGQSVAAGTSKLLLINTSTTFNQAGFFARGSESLTIRLRSTDVATSEQSAWEEGGSGFNVKSTLPSISAVTGPQYVSAAGAAAVDITISATNGDGVTAPTRYRYSSQLGQLNAGAGLTFNNWGDGTFDYAVPVSTADGFMDLYVRVYDSFYNESPPVLATVSGMPGVKPWLQRTLPQNVRLTLRSVNGEAAYAGIKINDDGSFEPNRAVTLNVAATSPIPLQFKILTSSQVELTDNVNTTYPLNAANATQALLLTTNQSAPTGDDYDTDSSLVVNVNILDAAGNVRSEAVGMRLNTRIYQSLHTPLRPPSAEYDHLLREVTTGGGEVVIPRSLTLSDDPIRAWTDIFYPTTHDYPRDADNSINETEAITMAGVSNDNYDAVIINNGAVQLDGEGRPTTTDWTYTKTYGHMLSSSLGNLTSWVIDNTGYGEFSLEFEYFDVNANGYGPPFNPIAPYRGDVLVVYDATAIGALEQVVNNLGELEWQIADTTKLVELYAFTGTGSNVVNLKTGLRMNSSPAGAFTTDPIRGIPKIAMIFYTDAAVANSGFKLKAGVAHDRVWQNFHVDETNGEVWVHKHSSLGTVSGAADTTSKRIVYDYLDRSVTIDYDAGEVEFDVNPSGVVTADYSYFNTLDWDTNLFLASHDDFVSYADAPVYVVPSGESEIGDARSKVFEIDGYGLVTTNITWDKDRGVLEIGASGMMDNRLMVADYNHHTYQRLSSDGWGDLTFYDPIVVADETPVFPDYTFVNVKVVNEGDAALEDGKIKFVPRGYDTNNDGQVILTGSDVVDQVLDINRPWDIQKGTRDETYDKMAMEIRDNFTWDRSMSKSSAGSALGTWRDRVFGDLAARSHVYGRAVWVLGGSGGSSYPDTTAGSKVCSMEVSGKYYAQTILT